MIYKEEQRDLFTVDGNYYFAQCISADFVMERGIAAEFNKRFNTNNETIKIHQDFTRYVPACLVTDNVLNLVTKEKYYEKPTYEYLKGALCMMRNIIDDDNIKKVAMPKIGCGLGSLEWSKVKNIIKEVFNQTDVEILVCYL